MKKQEKDLPEVEERLLEVEQRLLGEIQRQRRWVKTRHPFLFMILVTMGAVITFQGFYKIVNNIAFLSNHPWLMVGTGICILWITGTLHQKLK